MDNSEDFDDFPDMEALLTEASNRQVALNREKKRGASPKTKKMPLEDES
jgi:hypothetical protein